MISVAGFLTWHSFEVEHLLSSVSPLYCNFSRPRNWCTSDYQRHESVRKERNRRSESTEVSLRGGIAVNWMLFHQRLELPLECMPDPRYCENTFIRAPKRSSSSILPQFVAILAAIWLMLSAGISVKSFSPMSITQLLNGLVDVLALYLNANIESFSFQPWSGPFPIDD